MATRRNKINHSTTKKKYVGKKWQTAIRAAEGTFKKTGSINAAKKTLKKQALINARKLFGSI